MGKRGFESVQWEKGGLKRRDDLEGGKRYEKENLNKITVTQDLNFKVRLVIF